jgi:hypothetical protein
MARVHQAEGLIDGLGDPEPVFGHGEPLREGSEFSVAEAQPGPGGDRDATIGAKAIIAQRSPEGRYIPPQTLDGPSIVSRLVIGPTQADMRPGLEADMPERGGHRQGALTVDDGAVHIARLPASGAQVGIDLPEPPLIAERLGQGLGAAQVVKDPSRGFSQGIERGA